MKFGLVGLCLKPSNLKGLQRVAHITVEKGFVSYTLVFLRVYGSRLFQVRTKRLSV